VSVGTFADFHTKPAYTTSTYTSLTDERDNKVYPVVKIGGRWIMARNLNYQKDLEWQPNSNSPSTFSGSNTELIGSFWCPGGSSSTVTTSTLASCNVWGALYSWETAMSFDGLGAWIEYSGSYNTDAANTVNAKINHGRTASGSGTGGRGICPPNWHVPTDHEWGIILDGMESGGGTVHQNAGGTSWKGSDAGTRGKSKCTVADNGTSGDTYVSDTQANWYYYAGAEGTDDYGFRTLPSGTRSSNGSNFNLRGTATYFWCSSAYTGTHTWIRGFEYGKATAVRSLNPRSFGTSVRCIRDEDPTPPDAASTQTWTIGNQTWSAPLRKAQPGCTVSADTGPTNPPTAAYYHHPFNNEASGYLYNWKCVHDFATDLCPQPWSIPTKDDFITLDKELGGNGIGRQDAGAGALIQQKYIPMWGAIFDAIWWRTGALGYSAAYWGSEGTGAQGTAASLVLESSGVFPGYMTTQVYGLQVRCVK
jgi:uncharacterized protein (TIGR02145 family)